MRTRNLPLAPLRSSLIILLAAGLGVTAVAAENPVPRTPLEQLEFFRPDLVIPSGNLPLQEVLPSLSNQSQWLDYMVRRGPDVIAFIDPWTAGATGVSSVIPMIPGTGDDNGLTLYDLSQRLGRPVAEVDPAVVSELVLRFLRHESAVVGLDPEQLGPVRAVQVADYLWQVHIPQVVNGIPVRHGRAFATLNHGNLILFGTEHWSDVRISTVPRLTAADAVQVAAQLVGGWTADDVFWRRPQLRVIPFATTDVVDLDAIGSGYGHRLAWVMGITHRGAVKRWEISVDAHTGEILELADRTRHAAQQIQGGVYPVTSTELCLVPEQCGEMQADWPMPFTDTGLAPPNDVTSSGGVFDYLGGTVTTTLTGPYVEMTDSCGSITFSGSGGLNLGGMDGDHDCTTGGQSAGNTAAARGGFYELNRIFEVARGWLPTNNWLQGSPRLTVVMNDTAAACGATYSGNTITLSQAAGGCRNTGEIAGLIDHEWGHGLDDFDVNGTFSNSSEGYADIASIYRQHASCIGFGLYWTLDQGCGQTVDGTGFNVDEDQSGTPHCATDCSGTSESDWAKHTDTTPDTPQNFVCGSCNNGSGPCGRDEHCAATVQRQAAWDLVARDLQAAPFTFTRDMSFVVGNKLFYQGSGNIGDWYACNCGPGTSDGCAGSSAYMQWLAADDDNGNLNNGTPHMTAIFDAFDRHGIACASPNPSNNGCNGGPTGQPVLTVTPGENQIDLSWNAIANATEYWVFRTDGHVRCDVGKALIAKVAGTTYLDTTVGNGREYCYAILPASSDTCFGLLSDCECATPAACPTITLTPSTLPSGQLGTPYSQTVSASGGIPPYAYSITTGSLPPGLSLNPSTGEISGTPSSQGTFNFTVTATDNNACTGDQAYSLDISQSCPTITLSPSTLPSGMVGMAYSQTITASGGSAPYSFAVTAGTLPPGLSLGTGGLLSGTPTQAGPFNFTVTATDNQGCTGSQAYTIVISACPVITVSPSSLPNGQVGSPYSQQLSASGGTGPYTYFVTSGSLPPGISLSSGGLLSGTPTSNGTFNFGVTAVDANSCPGSRNYSLFIGACPAISVSPSSLPSGQVGSAYSQTILASGGTAPYTFTVSAGSLPPGLSLGSGGALSGTPTSSGAFNFTILATDNVGCTGSRAYTLIINACPAIALDPPSLPNGQVGLGYSQTITASGGTAPYTFAVTAGTLPPGLSLAATGVLSGTPSANGSFDFTVTATDAGSCTGTRDYNVVIGSCPTITLAPSTLPNGQVGSAYSQSITASGGTAPYTFAVTAGSLPPGMTLGAGGLLSGTPSASGPFSFTITATDAASCTGSLAYSLVIDPCPTITLSPPQLPNGQAGQPYSQSLSASGGTAPYSYTVTAGVLPTGLSLSLGGVISGTPTGNGTFNFTVTATDAVGCSGSRAYTIIIGSCPTITLSPSTLPSGSVGSSYSQTITASGGTAPYSFSLSAGSLPPGLSLSSAGVLSGTPSASGNYNFTVTAIDASLCFGSLSYSMDIGSCPVITITPSAVPDGVEGIAYTVTFSASGGVAPYTWSVTGGALPPGLSLDPATGELSGTPSAAGMFTFELQATDSSGCNDNATLRAAGRAQAYAMTIRPAVDYILGEGSGQPNGNGVVIHLRDGNVGPTSFLAYGAGQFGTNVASGDINTTIYDEILTGPGPGAVYGPHVRAWHPDGSQLAKVNFFAYGTLKFGINVSSGDIEDDLFDEILTGPGPGAVFGPHIRAWNFDDTSVAPVQKINFFAYGTLKYGALVSGGDLDGDQFAEFVSGPGPGLVFAPTVRGWDYDGASLSSIQKIGFNAFGSAGYGAVVALGDVDGDAFAEIAVSLGAGAPNAARFVGFNFDAASLSPLNGFDQTPFTTMYGGRAGLGDLTGDLAADLVAGPGPDPAATATVQAFSYDGNFLNPLPGAGFNAFPADTYGVNVAAGALGYY